MIQDLGVHHFYNQYDADRRPASGDSVIIYSRQGILISENPALTFPAVSDLPENTALIYLFSVDTHGFFLTLSETELPGFRRISPRNLRALPRFPQESVFAAFTAMHLGEWYRRKRFCGACGGMLRHDANERAMVCDSCGEKYYPRINPAVIVGVTNGDSLLITRYRQGGTINALIAGFTEIGETMEETVQREVMEEAGIRVKNIRYYKSQPWGIASDILAGFFCEVDGDDTIRMDTGELRYAEWVPRREIELQPTDYSLTNEMMRIFRDGTV